MSPDLPDPGGPPHSVAAEQYVLGAVMLANDAFDVCAGIIGSDDFYRAQHRRIWLAVKDRIDNGEPADPGTVCAALGRGGALDEAGGAGYVASLAQAVPTARNIAAYATIIRERSLLRQIAGAAERLRALAVNPAGRTASELASEAAAIFDDFGRGGDATAEIPVADGLPALLAAIDDRRGRGTVQGLATGLREVDRLTAGLHNGDLVILAGRPSMGKTSLAMQIGTGVALRGGTVVVFSLEMARAQLLERMLANEGRVAGGALRTGDLGVDDWTAVSSAAARLRGLKMWCFDAADLSVARMRAAARRIKRRAGCALVIVDYLQLLAPEPGSENRNAEITTISRGLKAMARELDCPVLALSQLSRRVEERINKRPLPSDLRDSGALEQDADVIALLYRDEVYDPAPSSPWAGGVAEINLAKQRNGPTGTVYCAFSGQHSRFEDLPRSWQRPQPAPKTREGRGDMR